MYGLQVSCSMPCLLLHSDLISWHVPSLPGRDSHTGLLAAPVYAKPVRVPLPTMLFRKPRHVLKRFGKKGNNSKRFGQGCAEANQFGDDSVQKQANYQRPVFQMMTKNDKEVRW